MPDELNEVKPGDLITARLINLIIQKLKALADALGGDVVVPNLFGLTLAQARSTLSAQSSQLVQGVTLDAFGQVVNINDTTLQNQRVIGQVPAARMRVVSGATVNLLIAARPSTGGPVPTFAPVITGFDKTLVPVGEPLQIIGTNFSGTPSENLVTFDSVPTVLPPSGLSNDKNLFVVVPPGIPGAPTGPGQANKAVTVRVQTPAGQDTDTVTVQAPTGIVRPTIAGFNRTLGIVGQELIINGTGFGTNIAAVRVRFSGEPVSGTPVRAVTGTTATLTIPSGLSGTNPDTAKQFTLVITVAEVASIPDAKSDLNIYTPPIS